MICRNMRKEKIGTTDSGFVLFVREDAGGNGDAFFGGGVAH